MILVENPYAFLHQFSQSLVILERFALTSLFRCQLHVEQFLKILADIGASVGNALRQLHRV